MALSESLQGYVPRLRVGKRDTAYLLLTLAV